MNTIRVVGIDIAKSVFQVCVWMVDGSIAYNKKISRSKLLDIIRQFEPGTLIAMEACSTSHFWGRTFRTGQPDGRKFKTLPTALPYSCHTLSRICMIWLHIFLRVFPHDDP